jgi:glycosyltransferase involved in cell wall biosynthesis
MMSTADDGAAPDVTVVAPLYRNAATIHELAARVRAALAGRGLDHELILVDDASPDTSGAAAVDLARDDPAVGVLLLEKNVGQHAATLTGMREARGRWTVLMDADLQDPPEGIPILIDAAGSGFDAVFAARRGRHQARVRLVTSKMFKIVMRLLARMPADYGMFMVLSRNLVDELCVSRPSSPSLPAMVGLSSRAITSVPIERRGRPSGSSAYTGLGRLRAAVRSLTFTIRWRWFGGRSENAPQPEIASRHGLCARP